MKLYSIITFILVFLLSGCGLIWDSYDDVCPIDNENDYINLSFIMPISGAPLYSRADDQGHKEVDSELRAFEDGIDLKDLGIFIFCKKASDSDDKEQKLLNYVCYKSNPTYDTQFGSIEVIGAPGAYQVNMLIHKNFFHEKLNLETNPENDEKITFRILVLANCSSEGTSGLGKWNQIKNFNTYSEMLAKLEEWQYPIAYLYNENGGETAVSLFASKRGIPMFGTNVFSVSQDEIFKSRYDNMLYLGEIDLLRALAKVRVIDNITNKDGDNYPKIIGARFFSSQVEARQIPYDAQKYINGTQVHTPNIYSPNVTLSPTYEKSYKLGTIPDNNVVEATHKGSVYIGYVPEQKIDYVNNDVHQGMPMFRITVALKKNEDGSENIEEYDVPMKQYKDQIFHFGDNILRNHIYSLSVNQVGIGAKADITFDVVPWQPNSITLDYTETVSFSKELEWDENSYYSMANDSTIVLNPWTGSGWSPLEGSFTFQTPIGATWTASLITTEGVPGSIALLNGDNFPVSSISGVIDGSKESIIEIVSTQQNPTEKNSARLQIVVSLGNGTVIETDLTPKNSTYKYYTIVQNPL